MTPTEPVGQLGDPWQRRLYAACFAAGWLTTGVIVGVVGGWWALLSGPVVLAVTLLGAARYGELRRD